MSHDHTNNKEYRKVFTASLIAASDICGYFLPRPHEQCQYFKNQHEFGFIACFFIFLSDLMLCSNIVNE